MKRLTTLSIVIAATAWTAAGQQQPFTITTTFLPAAIRGQAYAPVGLQTANDPGPVTWSFDAASPPPGFTVVPDQPPDTGGVFCYGPGCDPIAAVQTATGAYKFVLVATSLTTSKTATLEFTLYVVDPLQITTTSPLPSALANQPYSVRIQATGGTGQFTWSIVNGGLPPGMSLDPSQGTVAGIAPSANGTYTFMVQVLDQLTQLSTTRSFSIDVLGGLAITTSALPNATLNQPYSFQLQGVGGQNPIWSVRPPSQLPPQFSLSPGGLLTGPSLNTGKFTFTIQLADAQVPGTAFQDFTLYITLGPLSIKETTIPNANQNVAYRATLTPVGGLPPFAWSLGFPSPPSLSIDINTGIISGTPPNAGALQVPVSLRDSTGAVFSRTYTLNVINGLTITTSSLASYTSGVPYLDTLTAAGGTPPYHWDVTVGTLPPPLTLNPLTGQITGTPVAQGAFQFTIHVTDAVGSVATKVFTIAPGLNITTTSLPGGALTQPYSQTLAATGGVAPLTWTIASGALPPPLALNPATGVISGTPTSAGNFAFDVVVTDASGGVARRSLTINIANPVVVTSGNFSGDVLVAFSQTLTATGGTPPYTWSIASGTLPGGLQLNSTTGVISGAPSPGGTSQVTVTATDANSLTGSKTITITINAPPTPAVSISLGTTTQPAVSLSTGTPYPLEITGFLTLTFASSVGGTDGGESRFSDGTRKLFFVVRPNTTQGLFTTVSNGTPAILTGTVAGAITLTVSMSAGGLDITPSPAPVKTITVDAGVPVITSVTLQQVTGGLSVVVTGYSNTRQVSSGSFTFAVSSGNTLSQSQITVPLTSAYDTWFNNTASNATGGQFKLTVPFSVTGNATAVTKVGVTLTNSKGASAAVSSP